MKMGDRSTTDLLLLLIAATICAVVVGTLGTIAVIEIRDPGADTSVAGTAVANIINTLLGLLAGFLAGRTERLRVRRGDREEDEV